VSVDAALSDQTVYTFFRLGLVSGLVPKPAVFAWVDRQILERAIPSEALIELSLSERLPYSQVAHLLNVYQEGAAIDLPARLLLAQAGRLLAQDAGRVVSIVQGLCLLNAEYFLSKELRAGITSLEACLANYRQGKATQAALVKCLAGYLRRFVGYAGILEGMLDGAAPLA
jgi:hypothetical protein